MASLSTRLLSPLLISMLANGMNLSGVMPVYGDDSPLLTSGDAAPASGAGSSSQSSASSAASSRYAVPHKLDLIKAVGNICVANKEELKSSRHKDLLNLVARLREQTTRTNDQLTIYALYTEAENISVKIADPLSLLATVELRCAQFACGDLTTCKKEALARLGNPGVKAMLELYDHPQDANANATAGRYLGYEFQRWDLAFPLLSQGSNAPLKSIANQEIAGPSSAAQMGALAEAWYQEAKLVPDAIRDPAYVRTLLWYQRAVDGLEGDAKKLAVKHIAEVSSLIIQEGITDWNHLSPAQYARLRGPVVSVAVTKARTEIAPELVPVGAYRVVPDPSASWTVEGAAGSVAVDWHGDPNKKLGALRAGQLAMLCGSNGAVPLDLIQDSSAPLALCAAVTATPMGAATAVAPIPPLPGDIMTCNGNHAGSSDTVPGVGAINVKLVAMDSYMPYSP